MDDIGWLLPFAGGLTGIAIGAAARLDRFCTLAALERHWYAGDSRGLRTWVLAATIAIIVTQAMTLTGTVDLRSSFYLNPAFGWTAGRPCWWFSASRRWPPSAASSPRAAWWRSTIWRPT